MYYSNYAVPLLYGCMDDAGNTLKTMLYVCPHCLIWSFSCFCFLYSRVRQQSIYNKYVQNADLSWFICHIVPSCCSLSLLQICPLMAALLSSRHTKICMQSNSTQVRQFVILLLVCMAAATHGTCNSILNGERGANMQRLPCLYIYCQKYTCIVDDALYTRKVNTQQVWRYIHRYELCRMRGRIYVFLVVLEAVCCV